MTRTALHNVQGLNKSLEVTAVPQAQERRGLAKVAEHPESAWVSPNRDPSVLALPGVCVDLAFPVGVIDSWFLSLLTSFLCKFLSNKLLLQH